MIVLRTAERLGLCILAGCAILFILMPILIWRGQQSGELAIITLATAALAGLLWAFASRPTALTAAMEADRQLKLSDLLGTALLLRRIGTNDQVEQTVLALAEARCSQASPSAVVIHRLGARGWGGVGLAAALVAGLCLIGPDNARSQAKAAGPKSWQDVELENDKANATKLVSAVDMRRVKEGGGTDDVDPLKSNIPTPDSATATTVTHSDAHNNDATGAQAGTGTGSAQSASKTNQGNTADATATGSSKTNTGNNTAGGGGISSENSNNSTAAGGTAGAGKPRRPAPIWRSDTWPADQQAAQAAIRSGQIPDAYRDLVRDYFQRE